MFLTLSAQTTTSAQTATNIASSSPFNVTGIQTMLAYLVVNGFLLFIVSKIFKLGEINQRFKSMEKDMGSNKIAIESIKRCIIEMQTLFREKFKNITLTQKIKVQFGASSSPLVLKPKYKKMVIASGLDQEIAKQLNKLIKLIKNKKPKTGIDAQNCIDNLVVLDEIEDYIDTKKFKTFLYKKGLTSTAYYAILALYLYEIIIPDSLTSD